MQANLRIIGRVQGVFFRSEGQNEALRLRLTGWIQNEQDGSVSICVQGPGKAIQEFIEWCRRGPAAAKVEEVQVEWLKDADGTFGSFDIRY